MVFGCNYGFLVRSWAQRRKYGLLRCGCGQLDMGIVYHGLYSVLIHNFTMLTFFKAPNQCKLQNIFLSSRTKVLATILLHEFQAYSSIYSFFPSRSCDLMQSFHIKDIFAPYGVCKDIRSSWMFQNTI